jgi:hypothetical protein
MTTTMHETNSSTTTPPCPAWCVGDLHDAGNLTESGRRDWRDALGQPAPHDGESIVAVRDHTREWTDEGVWVTRPDALLADGTWLIGRTTIATMSGDLTAEQALEQAVVLAAAASIVLRVRAE